MPTIFIVCLVPPVPIGGGGLVAMAPLSVVGTEPVVLDLADHCALVSM
jgi:hypothetical protein